MVSAPEVTLFALSRTDRILAKEMPEQSAPFVLQRPVTITILARTIFVIQKRVATTRTMALVSAEKLSIGSVTARLIIARKTLSAFATWTPKVLHSVGPLHRARTVRRAPPTTIVKAPRDALPLAARVQAIVGMIVHCLTTNPVLSVFQLRRKR